MQTFKKVERLKNKKDIINIFNKGNIIQLSPFLLHWRKCELKKEKNIRILITVPKKKVKLACQRNFLKRRIREAYRKNKHRLYKMVIDKGICLEIILLYNISETITYKLADEKIKLILDRLSKTL